MPLWKKFLIANIVFLLSTSLFAQSGSSALTLFQEGQTLMETNPKKAYPIFVESMQLSKKNEDWVTYVNSLNKLAALASKGNGNGDDVFSWSKEAVEILKQERSDSAFAELHFNVAEFYYDRDEIDLPIYHYEVAKRIWTAINGQWNKRIAQCYHGLGDIYKYSKFDFHEAEKCYEKALLIREKINSRDSSALYQNFYSLAATNRSQHDYEKALSYGSKAISIAEAFDPRLLEETYGMVANIYRDMGESDMAKKYYQTALTLNKKTNNERRKAWFYMCLGETFKNDSMYSEALNHFRISYDIYTKSDVRYKPLLINLIIDMINSYSLNGDDNNFFKMVDEVFNELTNLDKLHSKEAYTVFLLLGDHYNKKGSYDSALVHYQKALIAAVPTFHSLHLEDNPTEDMIGFVYYVYEGLAKKASALKSKFRITKDPSYLKQSLYCLMLAEKLVSKERNTLDLENAKWMFLDANYDLYDEILSSLYEGAGSLTKDTLVSLAFRYFEQSKSRSLSDALSQAEQSKQISSQDSLFRMHTELKRKLFNVQDRINKALEKTEGDKEVAPLREEMVAIDRLIQTCKQSIEEKYPGYFNVKYGYMTPELHDVQQIIQRKRQVLLEYFWGTEWVYALGISEGEVRFERIGNSDSIKAIVNAVLLHFDSEHSSTDQEIFQRFATNAHRLYEILLEPFETLITERERIQIIPDGPLSQVPFEILLREDINASKIDYRSLSYMIKAYTIGYAYSSSMLIHNTNRVLRKPNLLAVGFTGGQRLRASEPELDEIAGAEEELELLAKRFAKGKFLVGGEATESNFKSLSPDFDIIHLAIHGKGDIKRIFCQPFL